MNIRRFAATVTLLAALTGCWTLPPGEPPENNITDNRFTAPETPEARREYMVTALATALLTSAPGAAVAISSDRETQQEFYEVLRRCRQVTGLSFDRSSRWRIDSKKRNGKWVITLLDAGKTVHSAAVIW